MSGLDESISLLNEEEPLKAQLDHLARQHDAMNIPTQYFHVSEWESRGGRGWRKKPIESYSYHVAGLQRGALDGGARHGGSLFRRDGLVVVSSSHRGRNRRPSRR